MKEPCPIQAYDINKAPHPKFGFLDVQFETAAPSNCTMCNHECGHDPAANDKDHLECACNCQYHSFSNQLDELKVPFANYVRVAVEETRQGRFVWHEYSDRKFGQHIKENHKVKIKTESCDGSYLPKHQMEGVRKINQPESPDKEIKRHTPQKPPTNLLTDWKDHLPTFYSCQFCDNFFPSIKAVQAHIKSEVHLQDNDIVPEEWSESRIKKNATIKGRYFMPSLMTLENFVSTNRQRGQ